MPGAPLPEPLRNRPFTPLDARRAGVSRRRLQGPQVSRPLRGAYVATSVEITLAVAVEAALAVLPKGTLVCGVTALQMLEVAVGPRHPLQFCSTHPHQVRRPEVMVMRVRALPAHRGVLVLPEHAFATAASHLDLLQLVTAGDWLLRLRRCSLASLTAFAASYQGRGAVRLRRAAGLVRERVDSPQESKLRLALVLAGLPDPQVNIVIGTDDRPIGRVDLVYQRYRVVIEYEGDQHRSDKRQWNTDIGRHEDFLEAGLTLIRVTALRMRRARDVVLRVGAAIRAGGYAGPAPTFTPEWCTLFEG